VTTSVTVTNSGDRDGDEVIQLYIRDPAASITRPVLELKGFVRLALAAGETTTVTFETPVGQLGFHDRDLAYVVEPGEIEVFVGTSSADLLPAGTVTITADGPPPAKVFEGSVRIGSEPPQDH
jgi:beta-glucosidase